MRFRSALATICTVVVATSGLAATAGGAVEPASADRYIGANSLVMGSTLTHWSFDGTTRQQGPADTEATERGLAQLHDASGYINVHLHGWGTGAPITKDGTPRWDDLDRRFGMIEASRPRTGPQPAIVLTACCSPRNFVDPKWGDKEWYPKPPLPQNYGAYAELVAETINRYPQISYVQVWNEMKGFSGPNRAQDYTNLYNAIWNAVKNPKVVNGITVRPGHPEVKIGGPYVVMATDGYAKSKAKPSTCVASVDGCFRPDALNVVTHWLKNKAGADFIVFDGSNVNTNAVYNSNKWDRSNNFALAEQWLRGLADDPAYQDAATLPLWWAEYHIFSSGSMAQKTAFRASALMRTAKSNAEVALIWGDEGDDSGAINQGYEAALFTNTQKPGGGESTPYFAVQRDFNVKFPRGTALYELSNSNRNVDYLASAMAVMATNMTKAAQTAQIGDVAVSLAPFETKFIARPERTASYAIAPGASVDYRLQLAAGQRVTITIQGTSASAATTQSFSVVLRSDPYRDETRQVAIVTADGSRQTVAFTAADSGTYVLKLRSRSARHSVEGSFSGALPLATTG